MSVSGPVSSTDNAVARWNGTGGNTLQDSGVIIDDNDNVSIPGDLKSDKFIKVSTTQSTAYTKDASALFQVPVADAFNRAMLWHTHSNDSNPAGPSYSGDGPIVAVGSLTADGLPSDVISEGIVVYGEGTGSSTMSNTNFSFARIKGNDGGRFQLRNEAGSGQFNILRIDKDEITWRPSAEGPSGTDMVAITGSQVKFNEFVTVTKNHGAQPENSGVLSISKNVVTKLSNSTVPAGKDPESNWSTTNDEYTCPFAGNYDVCLNVEWDEDNSGRRKISIRVNGADVAVDTRRGIPGRNTWQSLSFHLIALSASDKIDFTVEQSGATTLDVVSWKASATAVLRT